MAKKYLFGASETVPEAVDNLKFKKRTKGGYPKMNFHVFAIPRDDAYGDAVDGKAATISSWRYLGGFTDLSGLTKTGEVMTITDTDNGNMETKSMGKRTYGNITLNKGYDKDAFISAWAQQNLNYLKNSDRHLLDLCVLKLTAAENVIARVIYIANAWPATYTAGDMDTTTTDPWVNTLELAIDGWEYGFLNDNEAATVKNGDPVEVGDSIIPSYKLHGDFQGGYNMVGADASGAFVYEAITQTNFLTKSYITAN